MKNGLKKLALVAAGWTAFSAAAEWRYEKHTDEATGITGHVAVSDFTDAGIYSPQRGLQSWIEVVCVSQNKDAEASIGFTEILPLSGGTLEDGYRKTEHEIGFGGEPETIAMTQNPHSGNLAFDGLIGDDLAVVKKLMNGGEMHFSLSVDGGGEHTIKYDLSRASETIALALRECGYDTAKLQS